MLKHTAIILPMALLLAACSSAPRWMDSSVPDPLPEGTVIVSSGPLKVLDKDTVYSQELLKPPIPSGYRVENFAARLQEKTEASLANHLGGVVRKGPIGADCFDFKKRISTPQDNKKEDLPTLPSLTAACQDSLKNSGVSYAIVSPYQLTFRQAFAQKQCNQYGCYDTGGRTILPSAITQLAMYRLSDGQPVLNSVYQSAFPTQDSKLDSAMDYHMLEAFKALPVGNGKIAQAKQRLNEQQRGLEFLLGFGLNIVGGGDAKEPYQSYEHMLNETQYTYAYTTKKATVLHLAFNPTLRYMFNSHLGSEYTYSLARGLVLMDNNENYYVSSSHRLVGLFYPAVSPLARFGFGLGVNYTSLEYDTAFIGSINDENQSESNWSEGSGLGYLAKAQLDITGSTFRMGMSLGYEHLSADVSAYPFDASLLIMEMQFGFFLPL